MGSSGVSTSSVIGGPIVAANALPHNGAAQLNPSGDGNCGFISFYGNNGNRNGYIGYAPSPGVNDQGQLNVICGALSMQAGAMGFFGHAAAAQPAAPVAPAATGSTNVGPFGFTTAAQADAIVTAVNGIRTALLNLGLLV